MSTDIPSLVEAQVGNTEPDLSALTDSPPEKRKRPGDASPSELGRLKRNMTSPDPDPEDGYKVGIDEAQAQAATASVNVSDFDALQQAAAGNDHGDAANPANASTTAAAALVYPTRRAPQPSNENVAAPQGVEQEQHHATTYHEVAHEDALQLADGLPNVSPQPNGVMSQSLPGARYASHKPSVGSEEWHKMRKDNHKEVERRRRETINEGINELAKIVPCCEKNKGSILQNAVRYIAKLKEDEQQAVEKWTLEKLLTEQAITELSSSNDKLKEECDCAYRELEAWKRVAQENGLSIDEQALEANVDGEPKDGAK